MKTILFLFILIFFWSCHKDKEPNVPSYCWQCYDVLGNELMQGCGTDEEDAYNKLGIDTIFFDQPFTLEIFKQSCFKKENSCWEIKTGNGIIYYEVNKPEGYITNILRGAAASYKKIDCNDVIPCEYWYTRVKSTNIVENKSTYSLIIKRTICTTDSLNIYKNTSYKFIITSTSDSLVVMERSSNGASSSFY